MFEVSLVWIIKSQIFIFTPADSKTQVSQNYPRFRLKRSTIHTSRPFFLWRECVANKIPLPRLCTANIDFIIDGVIELPWSQVLIAGNCEVVL